MAENPSQIYTFSLRVTPRNTIRLRVVIRRSIIIDGQNHPDEEEPAGRGHLRFRISAPARPRPHRLLLSRQLPRSRATAPPRRRRAYTEVETVQIVRRYVLSLEVNRGPVGARISVLGRGFTAQDAIHFNGYARAHRFRIAECPQLLRSARSSRIATIRSRSTAPPAIRPSARSASIRAASRSPSPLSLRTGERQTLTFTCPNRRASRRHAARRHDGCSRKRDHARGDRAAGPDDRPRSRSKAASPASGSLFLKGFGAGEITIPVTGRTRAVERASRQLAMRARAI